MLLASVAAAAMAVGASLAPVACVTSSTLASTLPDGAVLPDAGPVSCVFDELDTYDCGDADFSLAPSRWSSACVDGDNCGSRVSGSTRSVGGCTATAQYQNVQMIATSCAAWQSEGGTIPVVDSGPPPACAPGALNNFTPKWHPPRAKTTACTKAQIDSYRQCLDDAAGPPMRYNPASCAPWLSPSMTDQSCLSCLQSNESDDQYGPLVLLANDTLLNVAGCLAMAEGKLDGSGCGGSLQVDEECGRAACLASCPISDEPGAVAEVACEKAANQSTGVCATYATSAQCAGRLLQADAGASAAELQCLGGGANATSDAVFEGVALAFCGP